MARYIDADKLKEHYSWWGDREERKIFDTIVDLQPTANVEEVTHGEWKKVSDRAPRYVCSACSHLFNNRSYKGCPFCRAKMDGKAG